MGPDQPATDTQNLGYDEMFNVLENARFSGQSPPFPENIHEFLLGFHQEYSENPSIHTVPSEHQHKLP